MFIHVLQLFILVEISDRVIGGKVFMPGARIFLLLNIFWCLVWFACFSLSFLLV